MNRRAYFRPAVNVALPSIIAEVKAEVSELTGLDPACFEIVALTDPDRFTVPVQFRPETCSTCGRSEGLFHSVGKCRDASPGECRNALRRVE